MSQPSAEELKLWYENVLLQKATESYLHINAPISNRRNDDIKRLKLEEVGTNPIEQAGLFVALQSGNSNVIYYDTPTAPGQTVEPLPGRTKMTVEQMKQLLGADIVARPDSGGNFEFVSMSFRPGEGYEIVDHHANDLSGFSATLFRYKGTPTADRPLYTLSMRSTEPLKSATGGDSERDMDGANTNIGRNGFALGQLDSMQRYFDGLRQGQLVGRGAPYVDTALRDYFTFGGKINVSGYSLAGHLTSYLVLTEGAYVNRAFTFNAAGVGQPPEGTGTIAQRYRAVLDNYRTYLDDPQAALAFMLSRGATPTLGFEGIQRALSEPHPRLSGATNLYGDRHLLAVQAATLGARSVLGITVDRIRGIDLRADAAAIEAMLATKITQIYGRGSFSGSEGTGLIPYVLSDDMTMVANNGLRPAGTNLNPVWVEDQPNVSGVAGGTLMGWVPRPLQSFTPFLQGDYGGTHSITLIADSLALTIALQKLDPSLTLADATALYRLASNQRADGRTVPSASVSEADPLENVLNAVGRLLFPVPGRWTDAKADRSAEGFGNLQNRERFHQNLRQLGEHPKAVELRIVPIETATSPEALRLAASTAGAMEWRYALKHLNPFVVQGDASIYEPHNANGELTLHGLADDRARASEMNPEWLQARAEMLVWMVRRNDADREYAHSTQGEPTRYIDAGSAGAGTALNFLVARAPDAAITHVVRFGGPAAERFNGDLYDDRLFGGAGADQIAGMSGADYLQGDAGADRLLGGAGNDTLDGGAREDRVGVSPTMRPARSHMPRCRRCHRSGQRAVRIERWSHCAAGGNALSRPVAYPATAGARP